MEHFCDDSTSSIENSGRTSEAPEEIFIRRSGGRQLEAFVTLMPSDSEELPEIDAHALVDSGCTRLCICYAGLLKTKRGADRLRLLNEI